MYHSTVKKFSRSKGQSATAAAAYRAGAEIEDARTGEVHDYTRRSGVVSSHIVLPDRHPEWATDRSRLWSGAEQAETRKNSVVAREVEVGLPAELEDSDREKLATEFTKHLVDKYRVAAEVSVHEPSEQGDQRNHHAHILFTTRRMNEIGFTEKTRELDHRDEGPLQIEAIRKDWEVFQNRALERAGKEKRVDCRSLEAQRVEFLERAEDYEERAIAVGAEARGAWRSAKRNKLTEDAQTLRAQATAFRKNAANLDREPGRHLGPARTAAQRVFQRRLDQMRDHLGQRVQQLREAVQCRVQSMRERFDKLSGRLFQQQQRISLEASEKNAVQQIAQQKAERAARAERESYARKAVDPLKRIQQMEEQEAPEADKERRSVADRLQEIRDAERDRNGRRKARDRGRDDPDFGL
ncbi:MAG: MobQ family relaxase [Pseudomonadota bacterium]